MGSERANPAGYTTLSSRDKLLRALSLESTVIRKLVHISERTNRGKLPKRLRACGANYDVYSGFENIISGSSSVIHETTSRRTGGQTLRAILGVRRYTCVTRCLLDEKPHDAAV